MCERRGGKNSVGDKASEGGDDRFGGRKSFVKGPRSENACQAPAATTKGKTSSAKEISLRRISAELSDHMVLCQLWAGLFRLLKRLICFVALDRFRVNVQEYASAYRSSRLASKAFLTACEKYFQRLFV
jgi:hypothetical protein